MQNEGYIASRQPFSEVEHIGHWTSIAREIGAGIDGDMLNGALGDEVQAWIAVGHRCARCAPSDMDRGGAQRVPKP